jgi:uncharacterized protein involved in tellurium resistance
MSLDNLKSELIELGSQDHMMVSELTVTLSWNAAVDLDLMAFYQTKSGESGGVYSELYSEGGQGNLNAFPYMQLDQDAGLSEDEGASRETLKIKTLDEISSLYLVAMNFSDAAYNKESSFASFDGQVTIENEKGQKVTVVLASQAVGAAALFATIEHTNDLMGPVLSLTNKSEVMSFKELTERVPGASELSLVNKLLLKGRGDSAALQVTEGGVQATLRWKASVDLDLHCFYITRDRASESAGGGIFSKIFGKSSPSSPGQSGHIYFRQRGSISKSPFIELDQDAGIGDQGGDNEENIRFGDIGEIQEAVIVANIFNKPNARFADYDGSVIVRAAGQELTVPLIEEAPGAWCVIAKIQNQDGVPTLINVNKTQSARPTPGSV